MKTKLNLSGWVFVISVVLTFVFLILKLSGAICWSWFWTLSPLVFGGGIILLLAILWIILALIVAYLETR